MENPLSHFLTVRTLPKTFIDRVLVYAKYFKSDPETRTSMRGKIMANAFFESSTRTSLSFEAAMKRLGGEVITYNPDTSSTKKGETAYDTIKTLECYSDIIVLRHPDENIFRQSCKDVSVPIINGGNGSMEHPSQALLDLYTICESFNIDENLTKILFVGDIKHSRTIHSLEYILRKFYRVDIHYLAYPNCEDSDYMNGVNTLTSYDRIDEFDVVYCTRLQKERFENSNVEIEKFILNENLVSKMKENAIIMHPLPRNQEISMNVDKNHRAKYFEQMKNGVYVRMALLYEYLL